VSGHLGEYDNKMDLKLFNLFMRPKGRPSQNWPEWQMCLEICDTYLKKHEIKKPIVVELGADRGRQKKFWEQLFGAQHIGIDKSLQGGLPDIIGDTHDLKTLEMLKEKLGGQPINMLFIDAGHGYEDVKKDFEIYSPLCTDIVMFHDIETSRYFTKARTQVSRFWDKLMEEAYRRDGKYKEFLFLSIYQHFSVRTPQMGIGMIIKR